jgi:hypothetical protein
LAMVEADLERAEERAESGESYVLWVVLLCVACFIHRSCIIEYVWIVIFLGNNLCVSCLSAFLYKATYYKYLVHVLLIWM